MLADWRRGGRETTPGQPCLRPCVRWRRGDVHRVRGASGRPRARVRRARHASAGRDRGTGRPVGLRAPDPARLRAGELRERARASAALRESVGHRRGYRRFDRGPRSITTPGSTSSSPASPTPTRRGFRRTKSSRGTRWSGRSATWPRPRDSLATLRIETAFWPVLGACASATGCATLRRRDGTRPSPPRHPDRAALLQIGRRRRTSSGAASSCSTRGPFWCGSRR